MFDLDQFRSVENGPLTLSGLESRIPLPFPIGSPDASTAAQEAALEPGPGYASSA